MLVKAVGFAQLAFYSVTFYGTLKKAFRDRNHNADSCLFGLLEYSPDRVCQYRFVASLKELFQRLTATETFFFG
jgi:hypothetical protein